MIGRYQVDNCPMHNDLPRAAWIQEVWCPNCGRMNIMIRRDWPEQGSDAWKTECEACRYVWKAPRRWVPEEYQV